MPPWWFGYIFKKLHGLPLGSWGMGKPGLPLPPECWAFPMRHNGVYRALKIIQAQGRFGAA
jgi:hypothetical protein